MFQRVAPHFFSSHSLSSPKIFRLCPSLETVVDDKSVMGSNSAITDLLECPVCMTFMCPAIHQCCNGHTICNTCKGKVDNTCPTCREELGTIRSIVSEKLSELLNFPCKFHELGCQGIYSYANRLRHEEGCSFRPYNCPYNECSDSGDMSSLVAHLKDSHDMKVTDGSIFQATLSISKPNEIENNMSLFSLSNWFGHQFLVQYKIIILVNAPVFMVFVSFLGEECDANHFRYSVEVCREDIKMTWQGIPRSIRDNMSINDNLEGLSILKNLALFLFGDGENLKLEVAGKIWRKENT